MKNRRNFYRLLKVQPDAPKEVIQASYRTLMQKLKYHPDLGGDEWNAALLNEACATLTDAEKRAAYDREQAGLHTRLGIDARAQAREGSAALLSATGPLSPLTESFEEVLCPFCSSTNTSGYQSLDECSVCASPLRFVPFEPDAKGARGARRIDHHADVDLMLEWPHRNRYRAEVIDLSPTGMRFVAKQNLTIGNVVKIESEALCAVASVTNCQLDARLEGYAIGVQFLTLRFRNSRGGFVSEDA